MEQQQHGKRPNLNILDNLKETVANLNKSLETLKSINYQVATSASTLKKQSDILKIKKTHELATDEVADTIRSKVEQFIKPTIQSVTDQYKANLAMVNGEVITLAGEVQTQKRQMSLLDTTVQMDIEEEEIEDEVEKEERRLINISRQRKEEVEQLKIDVAYLTKNLEELTKEIDITNERRQMNKPSLSKLMKKKMDLMEEKRRLIELENELKEKRQRRRERVDIEMKETDSVQSTSYTENKYEYIKEILSQLNDPSTIVSKSKSEECLKYARLFKEALPKKDHIFKVGVSNPKEREEWLEKKSHELGTGLVTETKHQKTTARVVKLLVSKTRVPLADLQKEYPIEEEEQHGLSKVLNLLTEGDTIRVEGDDIVLV
ncbi:hypothetical protein K501DRAFT_336730 [Backusella circina FSU 941]|nr:hypothetical protein K501DRAFT_336730 [Backusella circina FSU 941]